MDLKVKMYLFAQCLSVCGFKTYFNHHLNKIEKYEQNSSCFGLKYCGKERNGVFAWWTFSNQ